MRRWPRRILGKKVVDDEVVDERIRTSDRQNACSNAEQMSKIKSLGMGFDQKIWNEGVSI